MKFLFLAMLILLSFCSSGNAVTGSPAADAPAGNYTGVVSETLLLSSLSMGLIYGAYRCDTAFRDDIQEWRKSHPGRSIEGFGDKNMPIEFLGKTGGAMTVFGTFAAGGLVLNYPFALSVALAGSVAIIINMGMVNLLKKSFGRSRPEEEDSDEFRNGGSSMPSGHTAVAFCTASVIATEYNSTLVSILSYGTASAVGFSRLYRNKHWTSDVAAGAVLGIVTGKGCCWLFNKTGLDLAVTVAGSSMGLSKKF